MDKCNLSGIINARFSYRWQQQFLKRHPHLSKQKKTAKKVGKLRDQKEKLLHRAQLLSHIQEWGYLQDPTGIYNFDESPFKLAELHDVVIAPKGSQTTPIYTEGSDHEQITVLVGGSADGRMCRPLILFSGKCHVESRIIGIGDGCWFVVINVEPWIPRPGTNI